MERDAAMPIKKATLRAVKAAYRARMLKLHR
jgi:hypothetical protein